MSNYYIVARSHEPSKIIGYSLIRKSFLFLEGRGHSLMGGEISQEEASSEIWRDMFVDLEWFLSFLQLNTFSDEDEFIKILTPIIGSPEVITY